MKIPGCFCEWSEFVSNRNVDEIIVTLRACIRTAKTDSNAEYRTMSSIRQDTQQAIEDLQRLEKATAIRCEVSFVLKYALLNVVIQDILKKQADNAKKEALQSERKVVESEKKYDKLCKDFKISFVDLTDPNDSGIQN